jgi:hypothetical protein
LDTSLYSRSSTLVQWLKPSEGTIKIKIDGCSHGNPGRSGIGGLLRNGSGNWIIGFSGFIGLSSKVIVELNTIRFGSLLARSKGY